MCSPCASRRFWPGPHRGGRGSPVRSAASRSSWPSTPSGSPLSGRPPHRPRSSRRCISRSGRPSSSSPPPATSSCGCAPTSPRSTPFSSSPPAASAFSRSLFLIAFAFCGPWIARSEILYAAGIWTAGEAALLLTGLGVVASASGNILSTSARRLHGDAGMSRHRTHPSLSRRHRHRTSLEGPAPPRAFRGCRRSSPASPSRGCCCWPCPRLSRPRLCSWFTASISSFSPWSSSRQSHGDTQSNAGDLTRVRVRSALAAIGAGLAFALIAGPWLSDLVMAIVGALTPMGALALAQASGPDDAQGALATFVTFQSSLLLALGIASAVRPRRILGAFAVAPPDPGDAPRRHRRDRGSQRRPAARSSPSGPRHRAAPGSGLRHEQTGPPQAQLSLAGLDP